MAPLIRIQPLAALVLVAALALIGPQGEDEVPAAGPRQVSVPQIKGRETTLSLASSPFPHRDREEGYDVDGEIFGRDEHYADSTVTVYLPRGWQPRGRIDIVFFFHGWMSTRQDAANDFDLFHQFDASGTQAVLVIPETAVRSPDSFGGKFEDPGGFERFVTELTHELDRRGIVPGAWVANIVLAGHSGGYRVIASILRRGGLASKIREVWLFDALYARKEAFADWIGSLSFGARTGRFICVTSAGSGTMDMADGLAGLLGDRGIPYVSMNEEMGLDPARLRSTVLFLQSDADHFGVVKDRGEFGAFLATSRILGRPPLRSTFLDNSGDNSPPLVAKAPSPALVGGRQ